MAASTTTMAAATQTTAPATKYCGSCKQHHPVEEFWRVCSDGTELQRTCKKAMKESSRRYRERVGKEVIREGRRRSAKKCKRPPTVAQQARNSALSLAYYHRRKKTDPMKARGPGRTAEAQRRLMRYLNDELGPHPRQGRFLLRAQFCSACGQRNLNDGHHPVYGRNHLEDVMWLCSDCHHTLHRYERLAVEQGKDPREGLKEFLLEKGCIGLTSSGKVRALRRSDFGKTGTSSSSTTTTISVQPASPPPSPSPTQIALPLPQSQQPSLSSVTNSTTP